VPASRVSRSATHTGRRPSMNALSALLTLAPPRRIPLPRCSCRSRRAPRRARSACAPNVPQPTHRVQPVSGHEFTRAAIVPLCFENEERGEAALKPRAARSSGKAAKAARIDTGAPNDRSSSLGWSTGTGSSNPSALLSEAKDLVSERRPTSAYDPEACPDPAEGCRHRSPFFEKPRTRRSRAQTRAARATRGPHGQVLVRGVAEGKAAQAAGIDTGAPNDRAPKKRSLLLGVERQVLVVGVVDGHGDVENVRAARA